MTLWEHVSPFVCIDILLVVLCMVVCCCVFINYQQWSAVYITCSSCFAQRRIELRTTLQFFGLVCAVIGRCFGMSSPAHELDHLMGWKEERQCICSYHVSLFNFFCRFISIACSMWGEERGSDGRKGGGEMNLQFKIHAYKYVEK